MQVKEPKKEVKLDKGEFREKYTYIGRRIHNNKKVAHYYKNSKDEAGVFFKKLVGIEIIGKVIEVTVTADGKSFKTPYSFVGDTEDKRLSEWIAEDKAAGLEMDSKKRMKATVENDYELLVARVAHLYRSCGPSRAAFLFRFMEDVRQCHKTEMNELKQKYSF